MEASRSILVVEDDGDIREALVELLREGLPPGGFSVESALNGKDALDQLRHGDRPPSIVILDLSMPIMDGSTFLQLIETDRRFAKIRVIVITARGGPPEVARWDRVVAWMPKPVDIPHLIKAIEACG